MNEIFKINREILTPKILEQNFRKIQRAQKQTKNRCIISHFQYEKKLSGLVAGTRRVSILNRKFKESFEKLKRYSLMNEIKTKRLATS